MISEQDMRDFEDWLSGPCPGCGSDYTVNVRENNNGAELFCYNCGDTFTWDWDSAND